MVLKVVVPMETYSFTIQIKDTEPYFPVVLFIMLYKVVLILSLWMKFLSVIIQMKATEQYFPVLYKVCCTKWN